MIDNLTRCQLSEDAQRTAVWSALREELIEADFAAFDDWRRRLPAAIAESRAEPDWAGVARQLVQRFGIASAYTSDAVLAGWTYPFALEVIGAGRAICFP